MLNERSLTALALRASRGDTQAATLLVRHTEERIRRTLRLFSGHDITEDLMQETYALAFAEIHRFRADCSAWVWLISIARRVVAEHHSAIRDHPPVGLAIDTIALTGERAVELGVARNDQSGYLALRALLDDLESDRRLAFQLTQILGLSYTAAAQICHCPVGTIRSRVARARDDLVGQLTHPSDQSSSASHPSANAMR